MSTYSKVTDIMGIGTDDMLRGYVRWRQPKSISKVFGPYMDNFILSTSAEELIEIADYTIDSLLFKEIEGLR